MFSPKIKKVIFTILPALIVSGLVFAANIYYDLDLGKVIIDEVTRIVQDLEVLTGRIVGANEEEIKLGTTNDVFQVVRGGSAYYVCDSSGNCAGPQSYTYVSGTGTAGYLSKWTATSTLGNSIVLDNGTLVSVLGQFETQSTTTLATSTGFVGIATTTPYSTEKLTIYGNIWGSGNMILLGNITEATWQGNIIGIAYGGTGQDWSSVATGSLPYFSGIGVLGTLPLGNLNQILAASSSAPYWTDLTSIGGVTGSGSAGQVTFWTGTSSVSGDNNLFWDNTSKRLGIGTASPSYILSLGSGSDQTIWIERSSTGAGRKLIIQAGGAAEGEPNRPGGELRLSSGIVTGSGTSFISFYTAGGGPSGEGDVSPTEKMRIDSLGRVGIGITSPIYTLDVNGTLRTTATTTLATAGGYVGIGTTTPAYLLDVYSSGGNTIRLGASSTDTVLVGDGEGKLTAGIIDPWLIKNQYTSATTSLYIETSASPGHIILNPYGNVGVGTTEPAAKLEISIADLALKPFSAKRVGWETTATTTGTSTSLYAALHPFQRKTFYAQGLFWVFYSNGTNMVYVTSSDGVSWSTPTTIRACSEGGNFSVWFDGTYLHYAYSSGNICEHLYYRRGKLNPNGTITWSAGEQLVDDASCSSDGISWEEAFYFPFVSVDSNGYPLIAYGRYWWDSLEGYNPQTRVIKSSTNDGSWVDASGFPYAVNPNSDNPAAIIPLKGGKMLAIYAPGGSTVKARLWDGSNWGSETSTASAIQNGYYYSAVSEGDDAHLVFLKSSTYEIIYTKYLYSSGGFSGETSLVTATSSSAPVITKDADNNLYVFWASSTNHIYYRKYNAQSASWESIVDWIDESSTGLTANDRLTSFYKDYGGNIGLVYMTGTTSPYNIRFKSLILPQSFLSIQSQSGNVQIWENEIDQFRLKNSAGYGVLETDSTDWLKINPDRYYSGISFFSPVYFDNKIGIKTTNPTFNLSFGSESNQTIGVERSIQYGGKMLTIQAGGAAVGASNYSGGELRLSSGISTGSGSSYISFYTATPGASGTADNPPTEKMRITGSGNVGIGTTAPAYTLDVNGTLRSTATTTLATAGGYVGIGTTTPAYLLDVYSAGGNTIRLGASSTDTVLVGGGEGKLTAGIIDPWLIKNQYTSATTSLYIETSASPGHIILNPYGNVGIGTTTPAYTLDVNGSLRTTATTTLGSATSTPVIFNGYVQSNIIPYSDLTYSLGSSSNRWANLFAGTTTISNALIISNLTPGSVLFAGTGGQISQDNSNFYWDNTNKRLGIKTTTPQAQLHVIGADAPAGQDASTTFKIVGGKGGNSTTVGGKGSDITITAGEGGGGTGSFGFGGPGGDITLTGGAGGPSQNQEGGEGGRVILQGGSGYYDYGYVLLNPTGGNVGIGTTEPSQKLTVKGNIAIQAGANAFIGTLDNYALSLRTNNTDRIYITNAGNVGIGTTAPEYKLSIAGDVILSGSQRNLFFETSTIGFREDAYGNLQFRHAGSADWITLGSQADDWSQTANYLYPNSLLWNIGIGTATPTSALEIFNPTSTQPILTLKNNNGTSTFVVLDNGNVGIGTTTPAYTLDVSGTLRSTATTTLATLGGYVGIGTTTPAYLLDVYSSGGNTIRLGASSTDTVLVGGGSGKLTAGIIDPWLIKNQYTSATTSLYIETSASPGHIILNPYGNVGIGTTTPAYKLHILGDLGVTSNYSYRKQIDISGVSSPINGYQILITLDTASLISAGKMQSDCDDIRFVDSIGNLLPYWIESGCNSTSTKIWVKIPSLSASATTTIYVYYGNSFVSGASNGDAVFEFFDDFKEGTLDRIKWDKPRIISSDPNYPITSFTWGFDTSTGTRPPSVYFTTTISGTGVVGMDSQAIQVSTSQTYAIDYWVKGQTSGAECSGEQHILKSDKSGYVRYVYTCSTAQGTYTFTPPTSIIYLRLDTWDTQAGSAFTSWHDYVILRKYLSTSPTVSIGTEENVSKGLSIMAVNPYNGSAILNNNFSIGGKFLASGIASFGDLAYFAGYVGIGTTAPAKKLEIVDSSNPQLRLTYTSGNYVDFFVTSTADSTSTLIIDSPYTGSGDVVKIGADGTGKLTAGTLDPQYRIGGKTFATYVPSMTGVKEETTGVIRVEKMVEGKDYYQAEIDFNNLEEGSDLWLFSKVTALKKNIDKLSVLLTPAGRGKVWYQVDPENFKLYFFAERPTTISYRLTAPRWDFEKWPNLVESEIGGMVINEDGLVVSSSTVYQYSEEQNDEGILDKIVSFVKDALEKLGLFIENGIAKIKEIVTEKLSSNVVVTNQLCLGQTCIDEAKLKELLEKNNVATSNEQGTINNEQTSNEQSTTTSEVDTGQTAANSSSTEATTSGEQVSEDSPPPTEATSSENSEQSAMNSGQETTNNEQSTESSETTQTESSIPPQI